MVVARAAPQGRVYERLFRSGASGPGIAAAPGPRGCDRLVVAINSDVSVRRLKGPARPIQTELARAAVLACFDLVDLVVIFPDETPIALIELLRPDILVMGADYSLDQVVGADFVQSYGGRVLLAELSQGFSTSDIIKKINVPSNASLNMT